MTIGVLNMHISLFFGLKKKLVKIWNEEKAHYWNLYFSDMNLYDKIDQFSICKWPLFKP